MALSGLRGRLRSAMLRMRLHTMPGAAGLDLDSPQYLYLVQQAKRISLSETVARLTLKTLPLWPAILAIAAFKWIDLALANTLVRSLINEHDLLRLSQGDGKP